MTCGTEAMTTNMPAIKPISVTKLIMLILTQIFAQYAQSERAISLVIYRLAVKMYQCVCGILKA